MADGTHKPIEDVQIGDQVVVTDPETGETVTREVTDTINGEGLKHLVEITVDTDGDQGDATGSITATNNHPFWVADPGTWTNAADL